MIGAEILRIELNGERRELAVLPHRTMLEVLRDDLGLTGTKRGCDDASCGACTVLVDGRPRLACISLALTLAEARVETIEGVLVDRRLSALADALVEGGGLQCGYCTPGVLLAARAFLERNPRPSAADIRQGIANNLCRCTGYSRIVSAVERAALEAPAGAEG